MRSVQLFGSVSSSAILGLLTLMGGAREARATGFEIPENGTEIMGRAGAWTARFHFFGTCPDAPDSPHGHAAFFVAVPATASTGDQ